MMKITNLLQINSLKPSIMNKSVDVKSASSLLAEKYTANKQSENSRNNISNYSLREVVRNTITDPAPIRGMQPPNWERIPTKGMKVLPMDELIERIKELGVRLSKATSEEERDLIYYQTDQLLAQFVSPVSPDRKLLYKQAMQAIRAHEQEETKPFGESTLVDYLNEYDGIKTAQGYLLASGGTVEPIYRTGGGYDYNINFGGNTVMRSINGQWGCMLTPAELALKDDFYKIFWSSFETAKQEIIANSNSLD
ncbi:hypothetical protein [Solibacillus sp. CAU 1738]|uniref:hypothetical protein n=1 Tax=Solibacillus sp. CAU 1738 TaxID=3140363 RepID=UPI0032606DEB